MKEDYQCLRLDYQTISHVLQLPNALKFVSEILFLLKNVLKARKMGYFRPPFETPIISLSTILKGGLRVLGDEKYFHQWAAPLKSPFYGQNLLKKLEN